MDMILYDKSHILGKFNLIKNAGLIEDDQHPHTDYPPRLNL